MGAARLTTLDGMRGFAAIAVLLYHLHGAAPVQMPGGYLAVDFFFALSGVVICAAYERRLRDGLKLAEFATMRLIRVYPMYFCGALLALAVGDGTVLGFYPFPEFRSATTLFPGNGPMWSMFFEILVNLAFALVALRIGRIGLAAIIAGSGAILFAAIMQTGHADIGAFWSDAAFGLVRTVFSFAVGVAICRARAVFRSPTRTTALAWLLPPVLLAAMWANFEHRAAWDAFAIFAIMPTLVWLGARWNAPSSRGFGVLGDLSYPLYCIHAPIVRFIGGPWWLTTALILTLAAFALWLDRAIDRPSRLWLTRIVERRYFPRPTEPRIGIGT
jgi:peptidoglycan/LPS O-acetylase OafA/YrhL